MSNNINKTAIKKLLQTVDAGLSSGGGDPVPGSMSVESAVCYALGLPYGDDPRCVGWAVRSAVTSINDGNWSSNEARAKGLRKLAVAQLGSDQIDQERFSELYALKTIQRLCPLLFAELAKLAKTDEDRETMEGAGRACAAAMSLQAAVAILSINLERALERDLDLDLALPRPLAHALDLARVHALDLDFDFDRVLALDLDLVLDLDLEQDETLTMLADICLEVLVEMESPGCQWLGLCEVEGER